MADTVAEKMAHFVNTLSYDDLPGEVINKVKCCMINGISIGLSCHDVEFGRMARGLIKAEEPGVPAVRGSTIFCDGAKVTAMGAAFANAALFHGRAQEDTLGSSHTGTVVTPAVLALAEREGYTGRQVMESIIAGDTRLWDLWTRLSLGARHLEDLERVRFLVYLEQPVRPVNS